ncbi:MAG TPA: peptide deformylase [Spirochaetota bacterium]|nr:peptide deformylase [Spirochaetota bacterium]HOM08760.1 peptide deformylase [Spirochaetota bacterium]HPP50566.1 peptide deformylase [Spirochaetota bacterium]
MVTDTQHRLVYYGNKTLRSVAQEITQITQEIRNLTDEMFAIMHKEQGIGLAAPQIDVPLQLLVIDIRSNKGPMMALINPKITAFSDETDGYEEGCLSLPGITADIIRPVSIQVEGIAINEKPVKFEASGLLARVLQHEIDHLHGKLFIDYLEDYKRKELNAQLKKIKKLNRA